MKRKHNRIIRATPLFTGPTIDINRLPMHIDKLHHTLFSHASLFPCCYLEDEENLFYPIVNVNTHHIIDKLGECWSEAVSLHCSESIFDFSGYHKSFGLNVPALGEFGHLVLEHNICHHCHMSHGVTR